MNKQLLRISILIFIAFFISCEQDKDKVKFTINGTTNNLEDGTELLLINTLNDKVINSTIVSENKFSITGTLEESPTRTVLRTKNYSEYKFLWLENSEIEFNASNSNFRNAIISGSETEQLSQSLHKQTDTVASREKKHQIEMEFIKNHPNSIISSYILSVYSTTWGKEKTSELFENFSKENKETEYGKKIANYIQLNKDPEIGEEFVDFEMKDSKGKIRKLSDLKGKIILLEFWSSTCGPCRKENPNLVNTYEKYNPYGFEIFAVSQDTDKTRWLKAIEKDKLNWIHLSDLKGYSNKASLIYGIKGIPDNFLIDKNGIIISRNLRGEELNKKLSEIMPATNNM